MFPKLEVKGLSYSYHTMDGETQALSNISFEAAAGEFVAVVGPSGCGKSTLLSLICGLIAPDEGEILLDGKPAPKDSSGIGYMLQRDHLLEWRTIFENACLGLEIRNRLDGEHRRMVRGLLDAYGLGQFEDARPSELSGGMRQRAALIRTLALEPDLLLLDEPFSALDYQTRLSVCDDISTIIRSRKKTAVLITHDLSEAVSVADRIVILTNRPGRIRKILPVSFEDGVTSPLERRNSPRFSSYFNEVWKILQNKALTGDETLEVRAGFALGSMSDGKEQHEVGGMATAKEKRGGSEESAGNELDEAGSEADVENLSVAGEASEVETLHCEEEALEEGKQHADRKVTTNDDLPAEGEVSGGEKQRADSEVTENDDLPAEREVSVEEKQYAGREGLENSNLLDRGEMGVQYETE